MSLKSPADILALNSFKPRRDPIAGILLALALPMLVGGLLMPAISVTKLMMFADTYSIFEAVFTFWTAGEYGLFALVFFFSLIFPAAKILIASWAWLFAGDDDDVTRRILGIFAAVSRWSMLDVFIVAVTVLVIEGSLLTTADIHLGIILFALSVIFSTIALHRIGHAGARRSRGLR
jgi:paraquat-inducible protein A